MIKVEVIKEFTLEDFGALKNVERAGVDTKGRLYVKDTFECTEEMAKYLTGNNAFNEVVVKVIEVEPEKEVVSPTEEVVEVEPTDAIEKEPEENVEVEPTEPKEEEPKEEIKETKKKKH